MNISTNITPEEYSKLQALAWKLSQTEHKRISQSEVLRRALTLLFTTEDSKKGADCPLTS